MSFLIGWFLALTAGWTLIFSAEGALTSTAEPEQQSSRVRWVDALLFVSGRLVGTGSSNLEPEEALWSTAVALLTLSGVILLTLVIAWTLPVVAAVVQKRALDDVDRGTGLDVSVIRPLRQAVSDYLSTLEYVFVEPADETPGPPAFDRLVEEGIVDDEAMGAALAGQLEDIETRRALLQGYVDHDGWTWVEVDRDVDAEEQDPEETD